jgi:hypothetical protein
MNTANAPTAVQRSLYWMSRFAQRTRAEYVSALSVQIASVPAQEEEDRRGDVRDTSVADDEVAEESLKAPRETSSDGEGNDVAGGADQDAAVGTKASVTLVEGAKQGLTCSCRT